jgi:hypothetical protein
MQRRRRSWNGGVAFAPEPGKGVAGRGRQEGAAGSRDTSKTGRVEQY